MISIHALREEGDQHPDRLEQLPVYFYPRPPRGGRRRLGAASRLNISISIHALREEGDQCHPYRRHSIPISIHALREEGD